MGMGAKLGRSARYAILAVAMAALAAATIVWRRRPFHSMAGNGWGGGRRTPRAVRGDSGLWMIIISEQHFLGVLVR
jgi:hypothetical protein